jgi:uncharacterized membrane protein
MGNILSQSSSNICKEPHFFTWAPFSFFFLAFVTWDPVKLNAHRTDDLHQTSHLQLSPISIIVATSTIILIINNLFSPSLDSKGLT